MNNVIELLNAALTPLIAMLVLYVAFQQAKTNRWRARESVFDRRLEVYQTTIEFIGDVLGEARPTVNQLVSFRHRTAGAFFLFGEGIQTYLDELFKKATRLHRVGNQLDQAVSEQQRDPAVVELDAELVDWFSRQYDEARTRFSAHMALWER